ncbi:MAG: BCAM0308 family protein [Patescibacteria group bacterium]
MNKKTIGAFQPKRIGSVNEFGKGLNKMILCPKCKAVFYNKCWHKDLKFLRENRENIKTAEKILCPACKWTKLNLAEGVIVLNLENNFKEKEILNLVKNVETRAQLRDPEDRIIKIEKEKNKIIILTTENQLALSIAKQIKRAFKGELNIKWSHNEDVVRIEWNEKN